MAIHLVLSSCTPYQGQIFLALDGATKHQGVLLAVRNAKMAICEARIEGTETFKLISAMTKHSLEMWGCNGAEVHQYLTTINLVVALGHESELNDGYGDPMRAVQKLIERFRAHTIQVLSTAGVLSKDKQGSTQARHFVIMSRARLGYRLNPRVAVVSQDSYQSIVRASR